MTIDKNRPKTGVDASLQSPSGFLCGLHAVETSPPSAAAPHAAVTDELAAQVLHQFRGVMLPQMQVWLLFLGCSTGFIRQGVRVYWWRVACCTTCSRRVELALDFGWVVRRPLGRLLNLRGPLSSESTGEKFNPSSRVRGWRTRNREHFILLVSSLHQKCLLKIPNDHKSVINWLINQSKFETHTFSLVFFFFF